VREGKVASIAMASTSFTTNQTTEFLQHARRPLPERDDGRGVDYILVTLASSQVLASASIRVVIPAVHLADAGPTGRWYLDGGVRLNAPIKPAVALGVDRVVMVATDPLEGVPVDQEHTAPDVYGAVTQVLHAAMVDRMAEDVRTPDKINRLVSPELGPATARSRRARPYRRIPRIYVGPPGRG
jgi:NTE family protein